MLAFTIGTEFTAGSGPGFIPPDTMGSVGPDHIVELINGRYAVYSKTGVQQIASSLDQFWINSGVAPAGAFSFDPRVVYDAATSRFFATAVDNAAGPNNILVAVSNSSDPTAGWAGFQIDADPDDSHWADFPMLGLNNGVVTISANMFPLGPVGATKSFLVIPKTDLLAGVPTVANATLFENVNPNTTGFSAQPIFDLDNGSLPLPILSSFNKPAGFLKTSSIGGTPAAPTLNTGGGFIAVTARNPPPDIDQPGPKEDIDASNNRFSGNVVQQQIAGRANPSLWGVHGVSIGGRAAIEWYEIDAVTNAVLQNGTISDASLAFNYPSIAVTDEGDVVIGFSGGDPSTFMSAYVAVGETAAGLTTFDPVTQTHAGVAAYENLDPGGRNRWGDYSATVLDPADPRRAWTFQEFASGTDQWSVRVTEIIIAAPPEITNLQVNPAAVSEGSAVALTVDFDDTDVSDTHTIEIVWGDGSPNTILASGGGGGPYQVVANHTYDDDHPLSGTASDLFGITVTVTDNALLSDDAATSVTVNNVSPTVAPILLSTASIDEGQSVTASGTFSDPALGVGTETFSGTALWSDGVATPLTVNGLLGTFSTSRTFLDDDPLTGTPADGFTVDITISDDDTGSHTATSPVVTVNNVDPLIADFVSDATFANKAVVGEPVNILANFSDIGVLDTHAAVVDWGDGTVEMVTVNQGAGAGTVTGSHAYATGGIFEIVVTLTDDDTGSAMAMTTAVVSGVGLTPGGVLQIIGTDDNDRTTITKSGKTLRVFADFLQGARFKSFRASDVDKIVAYLFDGNDRFIINSNVAVPAIVHGGAGNDQLKAGRGPSVLLGDEGDDRLTGGRGRDILIGGLGADLLMGGQGEDLLIGGTTTHDDNDMALMDLIAEWDANDPYNVRVGRLRAGTGSTGVQLAKGLTVADDPDSDRFVGSSGRDWHFFDPFEDSTPDRRNNEAVN